jgi:hypothetical protein
VRLRQNPVTSVRIERVQKCARHSSDDVVVWVRYGSTHFEITLDAEEFTEARLRKAIARKLVAEFGFRRARQLKGKRYPVADLFEDYNSRGDSV